MRFSSLLTSVLGLGAIGAQAKKPQSEPPGPEDPAMKSIPLRTHSLAPPYLDSDMQSRWWDFGDDTIVRADQYVRLTSDMASRNGWVWSRVPLTATNWEIEVEFQIHGTGHLHGDGFAMWISKQRATSGTVFGSTDNFEGLGIFFDTYKNNRPGTVFPYVMAMMGDGQTSYDQANDGKANEIAGCSARGLRSSQPAKAKLTYYQDKSLSLWLAYKSPDKWVECFTLTPEDTNIAMPTVGYLGFSAHTGELSDNHDILKVETNNLYKPSTRAGANAGASKGSPSKGKSRPGKNRKNKSGSSWSWFLFKTVMFFGVIGGAYVGWTTYRAKQRSSRF